MKTFHIKWSTTTLKRRRHRAWSWKLATRQTQIQFFFFLLRVQYLSICFWAMVTYKAHITSTEICSVFDIVPLMWFKCIAHATCTMLLWSGLFFRPSIFILYECWMGSLSIYPLFCLGDSLWLRCGFFLFEGWTLMCFSQSSLYCCQRRWSGCIDRAMVHSSGIFYKLPLKTGKVCAVFNGETPSWT